MNEELKVIERVLSGESSAFEELIERHKSHVLKIVANMIRTQDISEVAHEVFIKAFKDLHSYRGQAPFQHWLSRLAVRTCYDHWRKQKRSPVVPITDEQLKALEIESVELKSQEDSAIDRARELLDWALSHLNPQDRLAFTLLYLEDRSMKEVSMELGWSLAQVKIRSFRSRQALRKLLNTNAYSEAI